MAPRTVRPLRLASQVSICSRFLRQPVLQSQGINWERLPRPSGTTPQIQKRKPSSCFNAFPSFAWTSPGAANSTYMRKDIPAQGDGAPRGNWLPSWPLSDGYRQGQLLPPADEHQPPRLRLSWTPRNLSHRGTQRWSLSMRHIHPEGLVQVTLVSRSKLLSPPARLRTHSGWNAPVVKPLAFPTLPKPFIPLPTPTVKLF